MTKACDWLRALAVTLGAAALLVCGAGVARADAPSMIGDWSGPGRGMRLAADGTGTLSMLSATSNDGETWSVRWHGDPSRYVVIFLVSQVSRSGGGLPAEAGDQYVATLRKPNDYVVLDVDSSKSGLSVLACTLHQTQSVPVCGP